MKIPEDKADLILEVLNQHGKRFDQMENSNRDRFDQIDKRFEQMENSNRDRFDQIDKRFERMENANQETRLDMREDRKKLEKIYESRKEVTVKFSRNWAWQNMMYSGGISVVIVLAFFLFTK